MQSKSLFFWCTLCLMFWVIVKPNASFALVKVQSGFENIAVGTLVENVSGFSTEGDMTPQSEEGTGSLVQAHQNFSYTQSCGVPDAFALLNNSRYLHYDVSAGAGFVWRTAEDAGVSDNQGKLFIDSLVQLEVWAEGCCPALTMQADQRLLIWAEAQDIGITNVCVAALSYDDDGWETYISTNIFRMANQLNLDFSQWHRLTVRVIEDVTRAKSRNPTVYPQGIQGFQIWLDGVLLQAEGEGSFTDGYIALLAFEPDPNWGWLVEGDSADEAVAEWLWSGTVFADLKGAGNVGIAAVGFTGAGNVDDLSMRDEEPKAFTSATFNHLLLTEANVFFADAPLDTVDAWLAQWGIKATSVAADAHAYESYLLNYPLGLAESPFLEIVSAGVNEQSATFDVTVKVMARLQSETVAQSIALQSAGECLLNGTLEVWATKDISELGKTESQIFPLYFGDDKTQLTIQVPLSVGDFFRARLR